MASLDCGSGFEFATILFWKFTDRIREKMEFWLPSAEPRLLLDRDDISWQEDVSSQYTGGAYVCCGAPTTKIVWVMTGAGFGGAATLRISEGRYISL